MTRALLVINFNDALCENSRASMQAAASRWDAELLEINESCDPGIRVSPAALKCFCFKLSDADEFFILDADVVVSSECPNPFEEFKGSELIAVANGSARFGDLDIIRSCERYEWGKLKREESRLAHCDHTDGAYFNTGMMLVRRRNHEQMFRLVSEIVQVDHQLGWNDQTPINMCAIAYDVKVRLVDERWNYIHPIMLGGNWLNMKKTGAFVYHGAGEPDRINWLKAVLWS